MKKLTFNQILNEQHEIDLKDKIMFSVLDAGWTPNKKYGNPKTNYYAFDPRSDPHMMDLIQKQKSFFTTTMRKDIGYWIVGLALNTNHPEVEKLKDNKRWSTSGRDGYAFAALENTDDLPFDFEEQLFNETVKSTKAYFDEIKNWNDAIKKI